MTNASSLDHLEDRLIELTSNGKKYSFQILIGNKCDLPVSERQISFEQASIWAKQHSMEYFEASAVTGEGITRVVTIEM